MTASLPCIFTVVITAVFSGGAFAADEEPPPPALPTLPEQAAKAEGFAVKGWKVEKKVTGDLNGDGKEDAAVVLLEEVETGPRRLLVAALAEGKTFRRVAYSDDAVSNPDEGGVLGDPLQDVTIAKRVLTIDHYGGSSWRWHSVTRYRWQNGALELIGDTKSSHFTGSESYIDSEDHNLSTGESKIEQSGTSAEPDSDFRCKGTCRVLHVAAAQEPFTVDGKDSEVSWKLAPGLPLKDAAQIVEGAKSWSGAKDATMRLRALRRGPGELCILAEVTDDKVEAGDVVRLVTVKGKVLEAKEAKTSPQKNGFVWEGLFDLAAVDKAALQDSGHPDGHSVDEAVNVSLPLEVQFVDVDGTGAPTVLSSRRPDSQTPPLLRFYDDDMLRLPNSPPKK